MGDFFTTFRTFQDHPPLIVLMLRRFPAFFTIIQPPFSDCFPFPVPSFSATCSVIFHHLFRHFIIPFPPFPAPYPVIFHYFSAYSRPFPPRFVPLTFVNETVNTEVGFFDTCKLFTKKSRQKSLLQNFQKTKMACLLAKNYPILDFLPLFHRKMTAEAIVFIKICLPLHTFFSKSFQKT